MNIQLITMWYNEEFLSRFFLNHYSWVDKIHIILDTDTNDRTEAIARQYSNVEIHYFQFPDMLDDIIKSAIISQKYAQLQDADYVIITDSDEFIFPYDPNFTVRQHLEQSNKDVYFVNLWQIYKHETDLPLDPVIPIYQQRRHGDPDMNKASNICYLKPIIARGGLDIFWGIGNHYIVSQGFKLEWATHQHCRKFPLTVAIDKNDMLQGSHWRLVDLEETIKRRVYNRRGRQSMVNLDRGLGAHDHKITEADIISEYEEHKKDPMVLFG